MYVPLKQHVDLMVVTLESKLEKAATTIQTGLEKAERALQISLAEVKREQMVALESAEKRVNEKFEVAKEVAAKTESNINKRMDQVESRLQVVDQERRLYINRDQLDSIKASIVNDIKMLQNVSAKEEGKTAGIGAFWTALAVVITILISAAALALTLWPKH